MKYPILPLRDIVVFPHMIVPLFVGRDKSVVALEEAMAENKEIILLTQKDPNTENPKKNRFVYDWYTRYNSSTFKITRWYS